MCASSRRCLSSRAFGCDINRFTFHANLLDTPQAMANRFGKRVSEEQCQLAIQRRGARSGVGAACARKSWKASVFPSMQEVATRLGASTRTLHNQLAREGTSYRELIEEIARDPGRRAVSTLITPRLTILPSQRLGYADTSSFVAAFKRWKGVTPWASTSAAAGPGSFVVDERRPAAGSWSIGFTMRPRVLPAPGDPALYDTPTVWRARQRDAGGASTSRPQRPASSSTRTRACSV